MYVKFSLPPLCLLLILLAARTAEACSCGPTPTVLDSFKGADVVVVVTAMSVEKVGPEKTAPPGYMSNGTNYVDGVRSTSMRVAQVFKGNLKIGDEMIFEQGGGADCIWTFNEEAIGQRFLFYLKRWEGSTRWIAFTCGRSNLVSRAGDDLLYLNNLNKVRNKTRISGTMQFLQPGVGSLAGLKIRISGANRTQEIKTDDNGVYEIYDLPAGRYYVEPEVPKGWKIDRFWLDYSPSVDRKAKEGPLAKIPVILEAKKHVSLDIMFEIDNAVRGHIYDPLGQPMKDVCMDLVPANGSKGAYLADCTEEDGAFSIDKIPPGAYVLIINKDGEITSREPFGAFYYPMATRREDATVFNIGLGDFVENLEIRPAFEAETVTVEGLLLYSDGKPVADASVTFKSIREQAETDEKKDDRHDAGARTDQKGRFSIKILKGSIGYLYGGMYTYPSEYENCPKLELLVKQSGSRSPRIITLPAEIKATTDLYDVELKFSFPSCKKAP